MIFTMAWRNIWRNKIRSIIIMLSIAVGMFAGIAVLALYKGMMKARTRTVIDSEVGHLQLHNSSFAEDLDPKFTILNGSRVLQEIRSTEGVKLAVQRSITNGMLATPGGSSGVQIMGVIPGLEYSASQLDKKLVEGKLFDDAKKNQVIIGKKLAVKIRLKPGSKLVLMFTDSSGSIVSGAFRIAGIYRSANAPLDERRVYIRMKDMNTLLSTGSAFHEIVVLLNKDEDVPLIQQQLQQRWKTYSIESWKEISPETDLMVNTTNQLSYILMTIIMLALAFGIINTMLMAILERTKEIGIMMALGTTRLKIFLLVILETWMLTFAGTPLGFLVAWFSIAHYNRQGIDLSGMGKELMSSFGYSTLIYPEFPVEKFPGVLLIVFVTALVSSLLPARKALMMQPVDALRR
jgi:putative ABC transport system permease protein